MATPPRKDNIVKFTRPDPKSAPKSAPKSPPKGGGRPGAPPRRPSGTPADLANLIRGREGIVGLVLIIAIAVAIVAWQRLSGG